MMIPQKNCRCLHVNFCHIGCFQPHRKKLGICSDLLAEQWYYGPWAWAQLLRDTMARS